MTSDEGQSESRGRDEGWNDGEWCGGESGSNQGLTSESDQVLVRRRMVGDRICDPGKRVGCWTGKSKKGQATHTPCALYTEQREGLRQGGEMKD